MTGVLTHCHVRHASAGSIKSYRLQCELKNWEAILKVGGGVVNVCNWRDRDKACFANPCSRESWDCHEFAVLLPAPEHVEF